MKQKLIELARSYATALQKHLNRSTPAKVHPALRLGRHAVACGLETLELARMHEQALSAMKVPNGKNVVIKRAEMFFREAITPIVATHRAARESRSELSRLNTMLNKRTVELATANRELQQGILCRENMETALKKSGEHYSRLLNESLHTQEGLRKLTHQVLATQEDERGKISHELQDEIGQTLLGINVRLLSLKEEARSNTRNLKDEIASTQRLVLESARFVRRAAREFGNS